MHVMCHLYEVKAAIQSRTFPGMGVEGVEVIYVSLIPGFILRYK